MQAAVRIKKEKAKSEYGQLAFFAVVLIVVYLARDILTLPVPEIVVSGWCALAFLLLDLGDGLAIFALALPLTVPQNEINIAYLVIMIVKLFIISKKDVRFGAASVAVVALILLVEMFNEFFYTPGTAFTALYSVVETGLPVLIPLLWYTCSDEFSSKKMIRVAFMFVIGVVVYTGVILYQAIQVQGWDILISGDNRLGQHLEYESASSMRSRGNTNGIASLAASAFAVDLVIFDKKLMKRLPVVIVMIYLFFIVILTKSRGAELCLLVAFICYALIISSRKGQLAKGLLVLGVLALAIAALMMLFPDLWEGVIGRFIDQDDITNGRVDIAKMFLDKLADDPRGMLIGYGVKTYGTALGTVGSPHNMEIDILVCWGFTGLILVFSWLIMMAAKLLKNVERKDRLLAILPGLIHIMGRQGGQYTTPTTHHMRACLMIMMAILVVKSTAEATKGAPENEKAVQHTDTAL